MSAGRRTAEAARSVLLQMERVPIEVKAVKVIDELRCAVLCLDTCCSHRVNESEVSCDRQRGAGGRRRPLVFVRMDDGRALARSVTKGTSRGLLDEPLQRLRLGHWRTRESGSFTSLAPHSVCTKVS